MAAVCVYCSSSETIDLDYVELASRVGARIGSGGHSLVSGGGRVSMMGAVARSAREHGARTVGVIPEHLLAWEVGDTEADELLVVQTMRERKAAMDERADAFLVLPGGIGTLEEFFEVWTAGSLEMHAKPVLVLDHRDFFAPLWSYLHQLADSGFVRASAIGGLTRVRDVDEAFEILDTLPAGPA